MNAPASPTSPDPETLSRAELEEFFHILSHELRNQLNGIALEAADLTEQAGAAAETNRLQERIRHCAAFLKHIRDLMTPADPAAEKLSIPEIIARMRSRR